MVKSIGEPLDVSPRIAVAKNMKSLNLNGFNVAPHDDYLTSRVPVLTNSDCDD